MRRHLASMARIMLVIVLLVADVTTRVSAMPPGIPLSLKQHTDEVLSAPGVTWLPAHFLQGVRDHITTHAKNWRDWYAEQQRLQATRRRHKCTYPIRVLDELPHGPDWFHHMVSPQFIEKLGQCDTPCKVVFNIQEADIYLLRYWQDVGVMGAWARQQRPVNGPVLAAMELEPFSPVLSDPHPDIMLSHVAQADVHVNYAFDFAHTCCPGGTETCLKANRLFCPQEDVPDVKQFTKTRDGKRVVSALFVSNCGAQPRTAYFEELRKYIEFDSFGNCWPTPDAHNEDLQLSWQIPNRQQRRLKFMNRYPFVFSFESTLLDAYVTEKFFAGFVVNRVPVYFGTPDHTVFLPGPNSVIDALQYSPKDLAKLLLDILSDQNRYASYFQWRKDSEKQIAPNFRAVVPHHMFHYGNTSITCNTCRYYANHYCEP